MAPKRPRTPNDDLPSTKRVHIDSTRKLRLNFNSCFSDELVLSVFSYLSSAELCTIQVVDSHWARLSNDNFLWRSLFSTDFPSQRLRGARGFSSRWVSETGPAGGREIKLLPARARLNENQVYYFPFKWMYRVSRNWRRGRCAVERVEGDSSGGGGSATFHPNPNPKPRSRHLLLAGDLILYSSACASGLAEVLVRALDGTTHHIPCPAEVVCMTLDHSEVHNESLGNRDTTKVHLVSFYSTMDFAIFSIPPGHPSQTSQTHRSGSRRTGSPVQHAIYKHPLLVTLTNNLELSIWDVGSATSDGHIAAPIQTFRSYSSFPPLSMSVSSTTDTWKLLVVYCTPVYPSHWLPAASELTISRKDGCKITGSRKTRSYVASSHGWTTENARQEMETEWSRKLGNVQIIETDGKFLVGADSMSYQVYRLHYRSDFQLSYVRTLSGHTSNVVALRVADGRCVSAGADGALRVWDLEGGWDVEVDVPQSMIGRRPPTVRDLSFDERCAVTLGVEDDSLQVWRFDL